MAVQVGVPPPNLDGPEGEPGGCEGGDHRLHPAMVAKVMRDINSYRNPAKAQKVGRLYG